MFKILMVPAGEDVVVEAGSGEYGFEVRR